MAPRGQVGIDVVWLCLTSIYPLGNMGPGDPFRPLGPPAPPGPTSQHRHYSWFSLALFVCLLAGLLKQLRISYWEGIHLGG